MISIVVLHAVRSCAGSTTLGQRRPLPRVLRRRVLRQDRFIGWLCFFTIVFDPPPLETATARCSLIDVLRQGCLRPWLPSPLSPSPCRLPNSPLTHQPLSLNTLNDDSGPAPHLGSAGQVPKFSLFLILCRRTPYPVPSLSGLCPSTITVTEPLPTCMVHQLVLE